MIFISYSEMSINDPSLFLLSATLQTHFVYGLVCFVILLFVDILEIINILEVIKPGS